MPPGSVHISELSVKFPEQDMELRSVILCRGLPEKNFNGLFFPCEVTQRANRPTKDLFRFSICDQTFEFIRTSRRLPRSAR